MVSDPANKSRHRSDGSRSGDLLAWLDERLPLTATWRAHLTEYYVPKTLNFWYCFGVLALVVLVLQIVTGIFLAMFYKPDASLNSDGLPVAFASVEHIMRDVSWGWLIRYLHSTGASAFFAVLYGHVFRGLLYGSYRKPRELLWLSGILLFLVVMAEAAMGHLLPWGQLSYWGAQVVLGLFLAIPVFGESLATALRGDYVLGDATLGRFFALHVVAVPLVLLGLWRLHFTALREVGSSSPDGSELRDFLDADGRPRGGIPFHPFHTVRDFFAVTAFFVIFATIVFFAPEGGGVFLEYANYSPADPLRTPQEILPMWYFAPFYAILRVVVWPIFGLDAKMLGGLAMAASIGLFAFLPWLDRGPVRSIRQRGPLFKAALAIFTVAFLMLGWLGTLPPSPAGQLASQICSVLYFAFFLLMPWYSRIDRCKPAHGKAGSA